MYESNPTAFNEQTDKWNFLSSDSIFHVRVCVMYISFRFYASFASNRFLISFYLLFVTFYVLWAHFLYMD